REDKDFAFEIPRPQSPHQLESAHSRHAVIGDHEVEGLLAGSDFDQRLPAVGRSGHFGRGAAQHDGEDLGDSFLVLDCQYLQRFFRPLCLFLFAAFASSLRAETVVLAWNANQGSDIAGYRVHYGTVANPFGFTVDVGVATSATISGLSKGVTYTFAVTAFNAE